MGLLDLVCDDNIVTLNGLPILNTIAFYSGKIYNRMDYDKLDCLEPNLYEGHLNINGKGGTCYLADIWRIQDGIIQLKRTMYLSKTTKEFFDGVQVNLRFLLPERNWKFFMPAACYGQYPLEVRQDSPIIIMDERLPYPLVLAYDEVKREGIVFLRASIPIWSELPRRKIGQESFLHATDLGAMGYQCKVDQIHAALIASLPYQESPISRSLDRRLRPITAFLPLDCAQKIEVAYEIRPISAPNFADACLNAYKLAFSIIDPKPVELPFPISKALKHRIGALVNLKSKWNGYTGLKLNFNPRISIDAPPTGYGRAFNKIESKLFLKILEYGFTGRQINNAYCLMYLGNMWGQPEWEKLGKEIVDSFVNNCSEPSGFLYTLYDVERGQPFHPFGDPVGSALHYGVAGAISGNYLRNMAEAAYDLVLCCEIIKESSWLNTIIGFGHYLLKIQNEDGSWYRAYTPIGEPIKEPKSWFGHNSRAQKASTAIPIPFLIKLYKLVSQDVFLKAAEKAGRWILNKMVEKSDYSGGTLDNPNVVDKEAMGYVMSGLLSLYEQTNNNIYLDGARRAGGLALTWNYLWDVPFEPGTRLQLYNFCTRGWGAIDVLWAGSVVDCYSLYFVRDWLRLAELTGEKIFKDIAIMIIKGTQQLLSYPGNHYELIAPGMQEEGFACSSLGMDEGLIQKGDTWGSLGWVYAITTYAILQVLREFPMLCES